MKNTAENRECNHEGTAQLPVDKGSVRDRLDIPLENDRDFLDMIGVGLEEGKEVLGELVEDLGMSLTGILSFGEDVLKILWNVLKNLKEKIISGKDIDWEQWFMRYVPTGVSDATIIAVFSILSLAGMPKDFS